MKKAMKNQASSDSGSEHADFEESFGQPAKDRTYIAHDDYIASPNIEIDESPRTLQIILVAASEDKPVLWIVRKIHCPVMSCPLNRPDGLSLGSLLEHVEIKHGLSCHDPRLGIYDRVYCTVPEIEQKNIIQPQHKLLEWCKSRCDHRYTYTAAEKVGYTHLMPPYSNSVLCIRPLRKAMPGLFSFSLPMLFYLIDPNSRLAFDAHDSEEDTLMLFVVLVIFALTISGRKDGFL